MASPWPHQGGGQGGQQGGVRFFRGLTRAAQPGVARVAVLTGDLTRVVVASRAVVSAGPGLPCAPVLPTGTRVK